MGTVWAACGVACEWSPLEVVLLHRPGIELEGLEEPDSVQMLAPVDPTRARRQHDAMARAFRQAGVVVHYVAPSLEPPPNQMFVADLLWMTPEGAVVARPASTVRAGEERWVARRLSELGIPILRSIQGHGVFEGADAAWIDPRTVLLATGLRTNSEGAEQIRSLLAQLQVEVIESELPPGTMHLMGTVRFPDRDLAIAWKDRVPEAAVAALEARGYTVVFLPDDEEAERGMALNFVTLAPRRILMAAGNPNTQTFCEQAGLTCHTVEVDELVKAAGGIACLTGVLSRALPTV